jgi:hypothetical protein
MRHWNKKTWRHKKGAATNWHPDSPKTKKLKKIQERAIQQQAFNELLVR